MLETPGNNGALGAPWLIDRDNDRGITVKDDRGYVVWNEEWDDLPAEHGPAFIEGIQKEVRERIRATVEAVNSYGKPGSSSAEAMLRIQLEEAERAGRMAERQVRKFLAGALCAQCGEALGEDEQIEMTDDEKTCHARCIRDDAAD